MPAQLIAFLAEFDDLLFQRCCLLFQLLDLAFLMDNALLRLVSGAAGDDSAQAGHVAASGDERERRVHTGQLDGLADVIHEHDAAEQVPDQSAAGSRDLHQA